MVSQAAAAGVAGVWSEETAAFRRVLGRFASGVALIDTVHQGRRASMAVNSFAPVSLEPPLVLFCARKASTSWAAIRAAGAFSVSFLTAEQIAVSSAFAKKLPERYELAAWTRLASGRYRLSDCVGWLDCGIEQVVDAGDHEVCIARADESGLGAEDHEPVVFYAGKYWKDMQRAARGGRA